MFDGSHVDLSDFYLRLRKARSDVTPAHIAGLISMTAWVGSRKTRHKIKFRSRFDALNNDQFGAVLRGMDPSHSRKFEDHDNQVKTLGNKEIVCG